MGLYQHKIFMILLLILQVPKPAEKNDFWIEEYRKDRSKSPLVNAGSEPRESNPISNVAEEHSLPEPVRQYNENKSQDTTDCARSNGPSRAENVSTSNSQSYRDHQNVPTGNLLNENDINNFGVERATIKPNSLQQQQQDRINSPFTTSSPTPNLPKPLSPIKSNQEPETQYYVRSPQAKPSSVNPSSAVVQNQWPPTSAPSTDSPYSRVAQSPARSMNPTARVAQSPARVISPTPRVTSPPPAAAQQKLANSRNVRAFI